MSFWDLQEQDDNSLQSLLEKENPDIRAIIENPEVIQSFRAKEEDLMSVLLKKENFLKLLDVVFTCEDKKTAKKAFELFGSNSPLLSFLFTDQELCESCIDRINKCKDDVQIGYATRLFQNSLESDREKTVRLISSSSRILPILFTNCHRIAVLDLLESYSRDAELEFNWFIWSALIICAERECCECPDVWKSAPCVNFASAVQRTGGIHLQQKTKLLHMVTSFVESILAKEENEKSKQVLDKLKNFVPAIVGIEGMTQNALKFALSLPEANAEIISAAKKLALAPLPSTRESVLALDVLTKFGTKKENFAVADVFQSISSKFIADGKNSIFLVSYIDFAKAACEGSEEILQKASEMFGNYILQNAKREKWHTSLQTVGFLLQIAEIIDSKQDSDEWLEFRQNELALWRAREDETPVTSVDISGMSITQRMAEVEDGVAQTTPQHTTILDPPPKVEQKPVAVLEEPPKVEQEDFTFKFEEAPKAVEEKPEEKESVEVKAEEEEEVVEQKPKPIILPPVITPIQRKKNTQEVSVDNFFNLINDPYWDYNGLPPEKIFHVKESFESAEEAFAFLVKQ